MNARIRHHDWAATPLGASETWPQSLRSALSICLGSNFPTAIYWGPELRLLYNDAWAPILAERQSWALGRPAAEVWEDIWDVIGPQLATVMISGEGFAVYDQMLPIERNGVPHETYWNYSFTAIRGEDGRVVGIFNQGNETTERLRVEARLRQSEAEAQATVAHRDAILNQLAEGVITTDAAGRVTFVNEAAARIHGMARLQVGSEDYAQTYHLYTVDGQPYASLDLPLARAVRGETVTEARWLIRRPDSDVLAVGSAGPVLDPEGGQIGAVLTLRDETARDAAETALRASEERLRALADNLPSGLVYQVVMRRDGSDRRFVFVSSSSERLTGVAAEAALADPVLLYETILPEYRQALADAEATAIATLAPLDLEVGYRRADGTPGWCRILSAPREQADGGLVWDGMQIDVTERFKAEHALAEALQAKDVLLHEVNHRVENSLQVVTSLLMLQIGQAKEPALRQSLMEARGRIAVVAAMHQRLYSTSQHDRVDFGDYVGELASQAVAALDGSGRISLRSDVDTGLVMQITQAVPLALVVSELITNAVKYGFPDGRSGQLRVALERDRDTLRMEVGDNGVGLPDDFDPVKSGGLGMRIVTALVRQVRGELAIERQQPGALFRISVPLTVNVQE